MILAPTSIDNTISKTDDNNNKNPIRLRGGRMHNLQSIDLDIPTGKLVVICGVSGSGKTSLALDTLYAEGQRRYIESFSPYMRQFLPQRDKPEYDRLENLPAAIAVKRSGVPRTNRSTVGTTAEVDDYLRILYARLGKLFCPGCNQFITRHDPSSVVAWIGSTSRRRAIIAFRLDWIDAQDLSMQLATLQQSGFTRIVIANKTWNLATDDRSTLAIAIEGHRVGYVVVDRVTTGETTPRIAESLETAFSWGDDSVLVFVESAPDLAELSFNTPSAVSIDEKFFEMHRFARELFCEPCNRQFSDPEPRTFSFNSSLGACPRCEGLGEISSLDMDKIVPDPSKTLRQGAIAAWTTPAYRHELDELIALAGEFLIPLDKPANQLSPKVWAIIQHGIPSHQFGGLDGFFAWLDQRKYKMHLRIFAARWRSYQKCSECQGKRLKPDALAFRIDGLSIDQVLALSIDEAIVWLDRLVLSENDQKIASDAIKQIKARLRFLQTVGLGYLAFERPLRTLSGGEATRVSLTTSLGSDLVSMLYVLDEPTIGLHPHDTEGLIRSIEGLRDRGNTVLVVEHEPQLIERADWIVDIGPQAGRMGGQVCFEGTVAALKKTDGKTGTYLRALEASSLLKMACDSEAKLLRLRGASGRNLKNIDVDFRLGCLCVVTGVSGSGKSSLVLDTLGAGLLLAKGQKTQQPLPHQALLGHEAIRDCVMIDQDPISLSSRSNPATYTQILDEMRRLFADTPDAKRRAMTASHFSFNNQEGQCNRCLGDGVLTIDMHFLSDIQTTCPACKGSRYREEILQVKYRVRSIAECLAMSVDEAKQFFRGQPKLQKRLDKLIDIGLGYLVLGQSLTTLSAGEAQRIKLASYLSDSSESGTLFLMDEPTTGLHFYDVDRLIDVMRRLIAAGHSLIVIEHNDQLIRAADFVVDLGPGAANEGGQVIATGTPYQIAMNPKSITGRYLQSH